MQVDALEQHLTTKQVAELWGCSMTAVYRMFEAEAGVLRLGAITARRRTRRELRIPASVLDRVYRERLNPRS
jgi:AraC-like DNA-binding protein